MRVHDDFLHSIDPYWIQVCTGNGTLKVHNSNLRMGFESAQEGQYTDAQIDDYTMLPRSDFLWKPPLRMIVRAKFSLPGITDGGAQGTAGFGFWNNPFSLKGDVRALPEAIWFFYSGQPSNMALIPDIPGWGWKAQSIHMMRPGIISRTIPLALAAGFGRLSGNTRLASQSLQRFAGAHEALIHDDMEQWHTYVLEWRRDRSIFMVDNKQILLTNQSPTRPLGFVAWFDNQYAIATPAGVFRFGKIATGAQWLDLGAIDIEQL